MAYRKVKFVSIVHYQKTETFALHAFANTANQFGSGITWAVDIVQDGEYKFYWRYATETNRPGEFTINETIGTDVLDFPNTETWDNWQLQASDVVYLTAGEYEVKLAGITATGLGNIDYMQVLSFNDLPVQAFECDSLISTVHSVGSPNDLRIYPVPAYGVVNIEILDHNTSIQRVSIYDVTGQAVLLKEASSSANEI